MVKAKKVRLLASNNSKELFTKAELWQIIVILVWITGAALGLMVATLDLYQNKHWLML